MTILTVNNGGSIVAAIAQAAPGDEIVVRDGVYHERIKVDKSGLTIRAEDGHKPEIDGGYTPALFSNSSGYSDWTGKAVTPGNLPSPTAPNIVKGSWLVAAGKYSPLVQVTASGVTLKGLTVRNVAGRGIAVSNAVDVTIADCRVDFTYSNSIQALNCNNLTITRCVMTRGSAKYFDPSHGVPKVDSCLYPKECTNVLIENNVMAYAWGEGINAGQGSSGVTMRGNLSHTCHHSCFYIDGGGKDLVFEDNVGYWLDGATAAMGTDGNNIFAIVDEERRWTEVNPIIRRNVFIGGSGDAFHIANGNPASSAVWARAVTFDGAAIHNNTIVGGLSNGARVLFFGEDDIFPHINSAISDNIWLAHPGNPVPLAMTDGGYDGVFFTRNVYNETPPGALAGVNDVLAGAVLVNPYVSIDGVFDRAAFAIPDPLATSFDIKDYRPLAEYAGYGALDYIAPEPPPEPAWKATLAELDTALETARAKHAELRALLEAG